MKEYIDENKVVIDNKKTFLIECPPGVTFYFEVNYINPQPITFTLILKFYEFFKKKTC